MQKINLVIPDNMDYRRSEAYRGVLGAIPSTEDKTKTKKKK